MTTELTVTLTQLKCIADRLAVDPGVRGMDVLSNLVEALPENGGLGKGIAQHAHAATK